MSHQKIFNLFLFFLPVLPDFRFKSIKDIDIGFLKQNNIKGLILDIDNTLTTHCNPLPADGITKKIEEFNNNGIKLIVLSNNFKSRVSLFADILKIKYIPNGMKPLKKGLKQCQKTLFLAENEIAIVGDQLFTDILGGNRMKMQTILCEPIEAESSFFFKLKRKLEKHILKHSN